MNKSITIMVPAYNEEKNLEKAVAKYNRVARQFFKDYEILIFDDGSADKTGVIADRIASKNQRVRVTHNKKNVGLGYNYRTGFRLAKKNYDGYVLHKTRILRKVKMSTNSFAYQAEILIRLLKSKKKYSYIQVPYRTAKTIGSSMFRLKNLIGMVKTVLKVFFDIYFKKETN